MTKDMPWERERLAAFEMWVWWRVGKIKWTDKVTCHILRGQGLMTSVGSNSTSSEEQKHPMS